MGRHMVANAAAVAAACRAQNIPFSQIATGLEAFQPVPGRMRPLQMDNGTLVIDDCYNANPSAVKAAIDVLAALPAKRILVLGDMGELGVDEISLHAETGAWAAQRGIELLLTRGPLSQHTVDGYRRAGGLEALHFDSHEELISHLQPLCDGDCRVLVKGSRSAAMEKVVTALIEGA